MKSFLSSRRKYNALDRMKYGTTGLCGLPTEIWQSIFLMASDPLQYFNRVHQNFGIPINWFFSDKTETILREHNDWESAALFYTRLSIIRVCKPWYFMGISILWSHIRLKEIDDKGIAAVACKTLQRSPKLASYVGFLSIIPHKKCDVDPNTKNLLQIIQVTTLLTNLSAIFCPAHLAARFRPSLHLDTAFITNDSFSNTHYSFLSEILIRPYFWHHCQTLYLQLRGSVWASAESPNPITFENLINLRISVSYSPPIPWFVTSWNLPVLKNLSIVSDNHSEWLQLIRRVRQTIEALQIPSHFNFSEEIGMLEMPRLKELHMIDEHAHYLAPRTLWHRHIGIPRVRRFAYYITGMVGNNYQPRERGIEDLIWAVATVQQLSSSLSEITIVVWQRDWFMIPMASSLG